MKNKNQVILAEMLKEDNNKYCSDCGAKGPRWASWNLGVFLCIRCAGIHRNLGVHISKVKSVNLDSWTPEQMANMQDWGNRRAGMYWECFLPKDFHRPQTNSAVETFIRNKYEHKKYAKKDGLPPKSNASEMAAPSASTKQEKSTAPDPTTAVSRPKAQPKTATPVAAPIAPQPNPPSADLLSLDTPNPVPAQPPPQPVSHSSSLADELIDFGAFQAPQGLGHTPSTQFQQLASLSQTTTTSSDDNEESLLKDDSSTNKSTKDSIMALFAKSGSSNPKPQMYGVPGGMYITPQQQPTMQTKPPNMMNGPPMQGGLYHHHQPQMMPMRMQQHLIHHATPQQQQAQLSQIQQQMQQLKLQKNPATQFPAAQQQQQQQQQQQLSQLNMYNTSPNMFPSQQAMNSMMTNQHMINYQQHQQPQFVSTGPVNNVYPMNAMPSTGHTFNNQLWK